MGGKIILLVLVCFGMETLAQHSAYSLQDAVDALRRREAQLALRNSFNEAPHSSQFAPFSSDEEESWSQEHEASPAVHINRHQLNKLLARYLAREENEREYDIGPGPFEPEFDEDNYISDDEKKKRSFFRERGGKYEPQYASVFRERELAPYETPELAEEFLREIEHEKELEREQKYKDALQTLWEKYEQQENEIKDDLFDDDEKKKRQLLPYLTPMEKKRSYPVLPWLPASRKKRFPVAKRSPRSSNEALFGASGTDEKVSHDLDAIFKEPVEDKKKRSADSTSSTTPQSNGENSIDKKNVSPKPHTSEHHHHGTHVEPSSEEDSHEGHDHAHEHDHEEDEEEDHDFDDEDEEDKKKKREIVAKKRSNQEVVREEQIIPGDLSEFRRKKSIDWSQYFGMNRKKKSEKRVIKNNNEVMKRSTVEDEDNRKKKSETDSEKLDKMDRKLKTIEDIIIDETVKYTGAHEGISDPDEIRSLKDHVVSRLATAYSLEKMRRALDKLRQSVENENHLQRNEIEPESRSDSNEKDKRIAVKKEKVQFDNNQHSVESEEKNHEQPPNDVVENDDETKKKKKRNGGGMPHHHFDLNLSDFEDEQGAGHFEPRLYAGSHNSRNFNYLESSQCPILDEMAKRCRTVGVLSNDIQQEFLPICGIHQLCYLCGTSQTACDFQYLSEADSICGRNSDCQSAARTALMILQGTPDPQLGPKQCEKSLCLYHAMQKIGL